MPSATDFFSVSHEAVSELGDQLVLVLRIGRDLAFGYFASTRHERLLIPFTQLLLRALDAVLGALAVTVGLVRAGRPGGPRRVEGTANDVVANAGQVLDAATADENDAVLLEVVTFTRNVARDFHLVSEAHATNLAQSRVWLLWRRRVNARANASLLRACTQRRGSRLGNNCLAAISDQLLNRGHWIDGGRPPRIWGSGSLALTRPLSRAHGRFPSCNLHDLTDPTFSWELRGARMGRLS